MFQAKTDIYLQIFELRLHKRCELIWLYKLHVSSLQKLPLPIFSIICSGSSMSMYMSASSCFLAPATCFLLVRHTLPLQRGHHRAQRLAWAYRLSRHQNTYQSSIIDTRPRPPHCHCIASHRGRDRSETLGQEPGAEDSLQQDYCSYWHNSSQYHLTIPIIIEYDDPHLHRLFLPFSWMSCAQNFETACPTPTQFCRLLWRRK